MRFPWRGIRIRSAAVWVISSWILAAVAGFAIVGAMRGAPQGSHSKSGGATLAGLSPANPLLDGQQISLASASGTVGFDVPVPDTVVASKANLTATWAVAARQQVALVFDQGELTIVMKPAVYQDPASDYQTFVAENNAKAVVGQVNGQPVLVISPDTDCAQANPAWVEFDLNGVDISIFSASYSTDQLVDVAASMIPSTSSPSPAPSASNSVDPASPVTSPAPCPSPASS